MKNSLFSYYNTDKKLEVEGKWFTAESGAKFLLKRMGGKNQVALDESRAVHFMPKMEEIKNNTLDKEEQEKLFVKVFVDAVLLDWDEVYDEEDNKIPYDAKLAEEVLNDCPDLFDELVDFANNRNEFKQEQVKNLGNS